MMLSRCLSFAFLCVGGILRWAMPYSGPWDSVSFATPVERSCLFPKFPASLRQPSPHPITEPGAVAQSLKYAWCPVPSPMATSRGACPAACTGSGARGVSPEDNCQDSAPRSTEADAGQTETAAVIFGAGNATHRALSRV